MTNFLSDYAELVRGKTYKSALCSESEGIPLLGLGAIEREGGFKSSFKRYQGDTDPRTIVNSGDLFFSLKDLTQAGHLLGSVARLPESIPEGRLTQDTLKLSLSEIDPTYVYWLLRSPQARRFYKSLATGTTNLGLAREDFLSLPIPPFTAERKFTVELLERIESKIELNQKMNQTLEEIAKAIFKSWFVDFDPVRAKAEGRPTGLPPEISDLFPDELVDSEIGEIPKGWSATPLSDAINLDSGFAYKGKSKGRGDKFLVTMGCVSQSNRFNVKGLHRYEGEFKDRNIVKAGDICVSSHDVTQAREHLGAPFIVPESIGNTITAAATNTFVVRPAGRLSTEFLYQLFQTQRYRNEMIASAKGTAILHISKTAVTNFLYCDPIKALKDNFDSLAIPIAQRINVLTDENQALAELRDALLPKLISGELRIPDAEKFLEEAGI